MTNLKQFFSIVFAIFSISISIHAQQSKNGVEKVFLIGDHQENYDQIISKHSLPLLTACNKDVDKAFNYWTSLLNDLEIFSEKNGLDIKGVKIWVNVFWNSKGEIEHFVFYPKPNSKNIDYEKMKKITAKFLSTNNVQIGVTADTGFSHFGTANFPIFAKLMGEK
jgi:hypothetical protein